MRKKKVQRKEKPPEARFVVVREGDCRVPKYFHNEGGSGFSESHARDLAQPVMAQLQSGMRFAVVPLRVFHEARAAGNPISAEAALREFAGSDADAPDNA